MNKVISKNELPEDANLFFKKDFLGYRIVCPIRNPDGKINWINLLVGGWRNFFLLLFFLSISAYGLYELQHIQTALGENCEQITNDPITFCKAVKCEFNFSKVNITNINYPVVLK